MHNKKPRPGRRWYSFLAYLLVLSCFSGPVQAANGDDSTITLSGHDVTLKQVFNAIRNQTGIAVMYNQQNTQLNQREKIKVTFNNTPLKEVLKVVFTSRGLDWTFNEGVIIIRKKGNAH